MHIHTERSAHGKVGVGLHDFDGQIVRVDKSLNVAPTDAGLYPNRAAQGREFDDLVKSAHVQMQASRASRLAAHAEPATSDRNRSGGAPNRGLDFLDASWYDDGPNRNWVEACDIIDDLMLLWHTTRSWLADCHVISGALKRVLTIL